MQIPALPHFHAGKRLIDTPVTYGVRSPLLEQSVVENWSDEAEAFRTFIGTRIGRHVTRAAVGASLGALYQATNIRWVRYSVKGVIRFVPVIGWGLLAYDLYNLGDDLDLY